MILDDSSLYKVIYSPVCAKCSNLTDGPGHKCKAYDERIPDEIWDGKNKHTASYTGDHGILYKERKGPVKSVNGVVSE